MPWFQLISGGNPCLPADWELVATLNCMGTEQICAIQTTTGPDGKPIIGSLLCCEMLTALHTRTNTTNVRLKD